LVALVCAPGDNLDDALDGLDDPMPDAVSRCADLVGEPRFEQVVVELEGN
jgi:hypothetical protein